MSNQKETRRNIAMPITDILERNCELYGNETALVEINPEVTDDARNAADMCPVSAIEIVEEDNEEEVKAAA